MHNNGNIRSLLPMAIEAGFTGFHGLEPSAGFDLEQIRWEFGQDLVVIGNIDVNVLFDNDLEAVRKEVDRCLAQSGSGGGYMIASCNSIFQGMNPSAVSGMFRFESRL